jgi:hypothetical protein
MAPGCFYGKAGGGWVGSEDLTVTKSDNRCINHRRPQPWRVYRCGICLHDAADDDAIRKNIVVVIVPLAGWGEKLMRA